MELVPIEKMLFRDINEAYQDLQNCAQSTEISKKTKLEWLHIFRKKFILRSIEFKEHLIIKNSKAELDMLMIDKYQAIIELISTDLIPYVEKLPDNQEIKIKDSKSPTIKQYAGIISLDSELQSRSLISPEDLKLINKVLDKHEVIKSDGSIKVRDKDKSVIRAYYQACITNCLLTDENKVKFMAFILNQYNNEITDRTLRNLPTKSGTDKASEYYKMFISEFPKRTPIKTSK
jgi:hypothetical protein